MRKAFYLKINRDDAFAYRNLERWIEVSYLFGVDCYVLCDQERIKNTIIQKNLLLGKLIFINSDRKNDTEKIAQNITTNEKWLNAALAHMTTFWNANANGYDYFWNIDADDTFICLSSERIRELLALCESYAEEQQIDCFSLDMWRTVTRGTHWSFGVTYINARKNWKNIIEGHSTDPDYKNRDDSIRSNIDWFFTYLKEAERDLKLETFCFENLKFIHYAGDFIDKPVDSGFYHWKDGKLTFPILIYCFGMEEIGNLGIVEDIVRFEMNIEDREAQKVLAFYVQGWNVLWGNVVNYIDANYLISEKIAVQKRKKYIESCVKEPKIILFGVGGCFWDNYRRLKRDYKIEYVCDNDSRKWGKEFGKIKCISPGELKKIKNLFVIITVYEETVVNEIKGQLLELGIEHSEYLYGEHFCGLWNIV
mgnify:CR=1 FL=1